MMEKIFAWYSVSIPLVAGSYSLPGTALAWQKTASFRRPIAATRNALRQGGYKKQEHVGCGLIQLHY
jgi:hypothetical protein